MRTKRASSLGSSHLRPGVEGFALVLLLVSVFCVPWAVSSASLIPGVEGLNVVKLPAIVAAMLVFSQWLRHRLAAPLDWADWFAASIAIWTAISILWASPEGNSVQATAWVTVCSMLFISIRHLIRSRRDIVMVAVAFLAGSGLAAIAIVIGAATSYQDSFTRNTAFGLNANYISYTLAAAISVALTFFLRGGKWRNVVLGAFVIFIAAAVYLTGTRGSFVAIVAALVFFILPKRAARAGVIVAVVVFIGIWIAFVFSLIPTGVFRFLDGGSTRSTGDLSGRVEVWKVAQNLISGHWFFGVGVGSFEALNPFAVGAHNLPLGVTVELGAVGAFVYAGWLIAQAILVCVKFSPTQTRSFGLVFVAWIPIALSGEWSASPIPFIAFAIVCPALASVPRSRIRNVHSEFRAVLLGFTVDDETMAEIVRKSPVMPVQTHQFAWNFVRSLRSAGVEVGLLSVLPVPDFPEYPKVLIRGRKIAQEEVRGCSMSFVNLLVLKHITRFLSCLTVGSGYVYRFRADVVILHGVHSPFLSFALILRALRGVKCIVVLTDPPGLVRPGDSRLVGLLKGIDRSVIRTLASRFDGAIALTKPLADDFAPGVQAQVMEGFADPSAVASITSGTNLERGMTFAIAYAGGLTSEYGVKDLVEAFQATAKPGWTLHLFGSGPLSKWIDAVAEQDEAIVVHGSVLRSELLPQLSTMNLLVNPRPPDQSFVRYSFPSKILEYMSLGVPVLSTRLSGIPVEYFEFIQGVGVDSTLKDALAEAEFMRVENQRRAERGKRFVGDRKTPKARGAELATYVTQILARADAY